MATPPRPLALLLPCMALSFACAGAPSADETQLPEGIAPGATAPRTDREVSRAPADRAVQVQTAAQPPIRDHVGIPVPAGSATSRALRRPPVEDEGEAAEAIEGDEGEGDEGEGDEGEAAAGDGGEAP